jgi:hypothetical protein
MPGPIQCSSGSGWARYACAVTEVPHSPSVIEARRRVTLINARPTPQTSLGGTRLAFLAAMNVWAADGRNEVVSPWSDETGISRH